MLRRTAVLFCLFSLASISFAQSLKIKARDISELNAEQRKLVGTWCRSDFEGARLAKDGWTKLAPLTTMRSNPDFRAVVVVSRYQMDTPEHYNTSPSVTYYVIGEYEPGIGYTPLGGTRSATFKLVDQEDHLIIRDVDPATPFVSRQAMTTWLKEQLEQAKAEYDRQQIQKALDALATPAARVDSGTSAR